MKAWGQSLGIIVAAGLGLGIGFVWRGQAERQLGRALPHVESVAMVAGANAVITNSTSARRLTVTRAFDDSPLTTQLARELSMSSGVARWLYWLEAIDRATVSDFPHLGRLAKGNVTAARLLASRWVDLDLPHLVNTLASMTPHDWPVDEVGEVLFDEWVRRAPDAAVVALHSTNSFGARENWRFKVAGYLIEKAPERGLSALSEWGIDNFAPLMTGIARWAADEPRHAAEVVLAYPAGYTSELAMETLGKQWGRVGPAQAMEFASSHTDELATVLAGSVLKHWVAQNLQEAADWLAGATPSVRHRFSPAFIEAWVKLDPSAALTWCESNLTGNSLARIVSSAMNDAALKDLPGTARLITDMKPSRARAEAAAVLAKHWFPPWRSGKAAPAAAITWLAGLDAASARRALEQVEWKWSNGDPKSMAVYLASAGTERVPASADLNLARALVRLNPPEAFVWANRLPPERSAAAGKAAFAEWRGSQPESALTWLNALPADDPRREQFSKNNSPTQSTNR